MAFGGEVNDARDVVLFKDFRKKRRVADVALNRDDVGHGRLTLKGFRVRGIGERIKVDEPDSAMARGEIVDEVGADETGPARDKDGFFKIRRTGAHLHCASQSE